MNRVWQWFIAALVAGIAFACGESTETKEEQAPTYFAFSSELAEEGKDELWGIMDQEGKVLFADKFESPPKCISGNRFFVHHEADSEDYYFRLYTLEAEPKVLGEKYKDVTPFYDGVALVSRDNKPISLIDTMGHVVREVIAYEGAPVDVVGEFKGGSAYVKLGDRFGFVNTKGEVYIAPKYVWVTSFRDGYALAVEEKYREALDEGDYYKVEVLVIEHSGKQVAKLGVQHLLSSVPEIWNVELGDIFSRLVVVENPFAHGKKMVYSDKGGVGLMSIKGEMLLDYQPKWIYAEILEDKYIAFNQDDKFGLTTLDGSIMLQPEYDNIVSIAPQRFYVNKNERGQSVSYIIDEQGKRISKNYSELRHTLPNGNAIFWEDGKNYLVRSSDGEELIAGAPLGGSIATPMTEWACNRQIDMRRTLAFLNITDRGLDGQTLEATTDELVQKHSLEHQIVEAQNWLGFEKSYGFRQAFYTYYFGQPIVQMTSRTRGKVLTLKPRALCAELSINTFFNFVPTEAQHEEILGSPGFPSTPHHRE